MFHVFVKFYRIFRDRSGRIIHIDDNVVFKDLPLDDHMDVVRLFHEMPDNSIMTVFVDNDPHKVYCYRFSKGELVKSEKDTDIDLFSWSYV